MPLVDSEPIYVPQNYCGVIPPQAISGPLWEQASALIRAAMTYGRGEYTLEDIHSGLAGGSMIAVGNIVDGRLEFVATTTLVVFPRKRVLYVQFGAGRNGAAALEAVQDVARALRCDWIETRCRESVSRLYRSVGFDVGYQVCIQEVK